MEFDLILAGGQVLDGTGAPARMADVGVAGERIAAVGDLSGARAKRRIDVPGQWVCPGFIDAHCHTDVYAAAFPGAEGKLMQGVTTDVCGLCGSSAAPIGEGWLAEHSARREFRVPGDDGALEAETFADYARRIDRQGNSTNMAMLVGNANLRIHAMGYQDRPATPRELDRMAAMLREAMEEGAYGLSTGLTYVPSQFADTGELVRLSRELAPFGGVYNSHMRGEGDGVADSIREVIAIARESGCRGHISHLKVSGRRNHGRAEECLELIHRANREGVPIGFDVYPYTAGSCGLRALLPPELLEEGVESDPARLAAPDTLGRFERRLGEEDWENLLLLCGEENIRIGGADGDPRYEGKALPEIAAALGCGWPEAVLRVLAETRAQATIIYHALDEEDLRVFVQDPLCMLGTDAFARHYNGPTASGKPHPRNYGAFPRFLRRYLLEMNWLGVPEGIRRMTALPAETFGLTGRGRVAEGYLADLCVLDPETVAETGSYTDPAHPPQGVRWVLQAGMVVVDHGAFQDLRQGRMLRKHAES